MRGIRLARTTDPETSHQAAASLDPVKMRAQHEYVLKLLRKPGTDFDIACRWIEDHKNYASQNYSPSGLRTRRKELVDMGKVRDSGKRVVLEATGRKAIVWERVRDDE